MFIPLEYRKHKHRYKITFNDKFITWKFFYCCFENKDDIEYFDFKNIKNIQISLENE